MDEEATIYAIVQLGNNRVVTKFRSEINFVSSSRQVDVIEMGLHATAVAHRAAVLTPIRYRRERRRFLP